MLEDSGGLAASRVPAYNARVSRVEGSRQIGDVLERDWIETHCIQGPCIRAFTQQSCQQSYRSIDAYY